MYRTIRKILFVTRKRFICGSKYIIWRRTTYHKISILKKLSLTFNFCLYNIHFAAQSKKIWIFLLYLYWISNESLYIWLSKICFYFVSNKCKNNNTIISNTNVNVKKMHRIINKYEVGAHFDLKLSRFWTIHMILARRMFWQQLIDTSGCINQNNSKLLSHIPKIKQILPGNREKLKIIASASLYKNNKRIKR